MQTFVHMQRAGCMNVCTRGYRWCMASQAKIVVTVTSTRGGSTITYSTKGRYVSFTTAGYQRQKLKEPIQSTASLSGFWLGVLGEVVADITANPTPP